MWKQPLVLLLSALCAGCVKERTFSPGTSVPSTPGAIARGTLVINEFVAAGSTNVNEFDTAEDWFEIYNPGASAIDLEEGDWFVSDGGPASPTKFALPAMRIPAHGFVVIWCDNLNTVAEQVHTNFALSSAGEHLVIYYDDGAEGVVVDDYSFGPVEVPGSSTGRTPDGAAQWTSFSTPTPGASNQ